MRHEATAATQTPETQLLPVRHGDDEQGSRVDVDVNVRVEVDVEVTVFVVDVTVVDVRVKVVVGEPGVVEVGVIVVEQ